MLLNKHPIVACRTTQSVLSKMSVVPAIVKKKVKLRVPATPRISVAAIIVPHHKLPFHICPFCMCAFY